MMNSLHWEEGQNGEKNVDCWEITIVVVGAIIWLEESKYWILYWLDVWKHDANADYVLCLPGVFISVLVMLMQMKSEERLINVKHLW